jgi:GNAT superfamily N-acetyltransferase
VKLPLGRKSDGTLHPHQENGFVTPVITSARTSEWLAAFELAFQRCSPDERPMRVVDALAMAAAGEIDPQGIFVAHQGDRLVGVVVAMPLAGASGLLWMPETVSEAAASLATELVRAGLAFFAKRGTKIAEAIVPPEDLQRTAPFLEAGMRHVGRLRYLRHDLILLPEMPASPQLRLASSRDVSPEIFSATLARTYRGTLDFPELNDIRTIDEILEGHRRAGVHRPENWLIASIAGEPTGVVFLTEVPGEAWDLSYLGVVPEHRGGGVGRKLAHAALRLAQLAGCLELSVAADERNVPALQLYRSLGFSEGASREVFLMFL